MKKIFNELRKVNFQILKRPKELVKFTNRVVLISIFGTILSDLLAFTLKIGEIAIGSNLKVLAISMLLMHFGDRVFESIYETFSDIQHDTYNQLQTGYSTSVVLIVCNAVKGKIFKEKNGNKVMIEYPEIIQKTKDYTADCWRLYVSIPRLITESLILIAMLVSTVVLEVKMTSMLEGIIILMFMILCVVCYFYMSFKRTQVMKDYRKSRKEMEAQVEVQYTALKTSDFLNTKDFNYHADKLKATLHDKIEVEKKENLKLNKVFVKRSIIASMMMIIIMIIKIIFAGKFNLAVFVDIVAFSSICSTILHRISSITRNIEDIMDIFVDIDSLYDDFKAVNDVYESEKNKMIISTPVESIAINDFVVTQDPNGSYNLINHGSVVLKQNNIYLVSGPTGCGKSTLIYMLTGKLALQDSPIVFSNGKNGYLSSIAYQTDKIILNNIVLNEIALTDNIDEIDFDKIIALLKGLHLYDEILDMAGNVILSKDNDDKVIEFISSRKSREFSSGQMQRLALAKLLYNVTPEIQMVCLDEPDNRLDESTAKDCMEFVTNYLQRSNIIIIVASHKLSIWQDKVDHNITFIEKQGKSYLEFN